MNSLFIDLEIAKRVDYKIKNALSEFVHRDLDYKSNFLQSEYNTAFDGYSYIGQSNSLNQSKTDMLHSFVLSEFQDFKSFPKEFHTFLKEDWTALIDMVRSIEMRRIDKLNNPVLKQLYDDNIIGYMMSCNYYPKPINCALAEKAHTRLSTHKDASLFTTFPFGVDKGLSIYQGTKDPIEIGKKETMFSFSGYFLEFVTNNEITALNHQVDFPENLSSERFSFAIFSIPKPNTSFYLSDKEIKSEDYYKEYLAQF